ADQLDLVGKYIGGEVPKLHRLGGAEWGRQKARVRRAVRDIAGERVKLYAERSNVSGYAFSADQPWQRELEDAFPYMETRDQLAAIDEVKVDMERASPMDRLICGDVGYGKTEIALRAAFKSVLDGKQVAVLVPTTLLAQQHYATFSERFAPFPVRVAVLSRFVRAKEQAAMLEEIAAGKVDVVIGTHRLLQKDVRFADLGLLVVDEDARVGVAHGQMNERQLERVMLDFWDKAYDVLITTTIIESGLDIPTANTLVVERADRMGLAQLYQLRGRVGRSRERAYAYFFFPPERELTEASHARLAAISQFT